MQYFRLLIFFIVVITFSSCCKEENIYSEKQYKVVSIYSYKTKITRLLNFVNSKLVSYTVADIYTEIVEDSVNSIFYENVKFGQKYKWVFKNDTIKIIETGSINNLSILILKDNKILSCFDSLKNEIHEFEYSNDLIVKSSLTKTGATSPYKIFEYKYNDFKFNDYFDGLNYINQYLWSIRMSSDFFKFNINFKSYDEIYIVDETQPLGQREYRYKYIYNIDSSNTLISKTVKELINNKHIDSFHFNYIY